MQKIFIKLKMRVKNLLGRLKRQKNGLKQWLSAKINNRRPLNRKS